jgi:hypothetical protein
MPTADSPIAREEAQGKFKNPRGFVLNPELENHISRRELSTSGLDPYGGQGSHP